jgi:hypothetical protein
MNIGHWQKAYEIKKYITSQIILGLMNAPIKLLYFFQLQGWEKEDLDPNEESDPYQERTVTGSNENPGSDLKLYFSLWFAWNPERISWVNPQFDLVPQKKGGKQGFLPTDYFIIIKYLNNTNVIREQNMK